MTDERRDYGDEPHTFLDDRNTAHFFERLAEFFEEHPGSANATGG